MDDTATATLTKWGNSQGVIIPKNICRAAHFNIGDSALIAVDDKGRIILEHKETPTYTRRRVMSLEEFAAGWSGERIGEEWGDADVGAEVVL
ncbi:MAG: AbrB/MazE/SpoVT family DNA-binding domain-containing protein [Coriobacteriia bacterium]|nr:AbrB/MazE/SpoVT family DNA-binding domain-containing protein [Coriobacteriia bacterium]